jgi:hypothetical protein
VSGDFFQVALALFNSTVCSIGQHSGA